LEFYFDFFRYDPSKYAGRDDDDSDMEADFATIEREEERRYGFFSFYCNICTRNKPYR
jgi:hypothetical protein